jgi:hypothetical protein
LTNHTRSSSALSSLARLGSLVALGAGYYFLARPRLNTAGTKEGEPTRKLPGDDLIPVTNFQSTHAIDIETPVEAVWPWIAQIGRDNSGYYGIDSVSNRGLPSVSYLRQDLSTPQVGNPMDGGFRILDLHENQYLVYGAFDLPTPMGQPMERTTALYLEQRITGTARLIIRTRGYAYGTLGKLWVLAFEVLDYLETLMMLRNLKERAEMMQALTKSVKPAQVV